MSAPMTPEQRDAIAHQLGDAKPATDGLLGSLAESVTNVRTHDHPKWEDLYCMNLTSYMGERMAPVLRRLLEAEAEWVAFRDQRNAVCADNEELLARVERSGLARLQAENETRTVVRERDALRARVAELEADVAAKAQDTEAAVAGWGRARARIEELVTGQAPPEALSPWERAVAGLNALVDADVIFRVEPDGHISAPFSDEHIEWDLKAKRWVITHDDEDEAPVRQCGCGRDAHSNLSLCQPMTADEWNERYPIGTPVLAYPGTRDDEPLDTATRTPAWTLGHGAAVVSVKGYPGGICLTHVDPVGGAL